MNKYTFNFSCICPNDRETISYKAIIETEEMIMVEDINDYIYSLSDKEMFQESLTEKMLMEFSITGKSEAASKFDKWNGHVVKVTTFGTHQGVEIKCQKGSLFK